MHLRRVIAALRSITAETSPVPPMQDTDPGLMTKDEFLRHRNPRDKQHPENAYERDMDVGSFWPNRGLHTIGKAWVGRRDPDLVALGDGTTAYTALVFEDNDHVVAVLHDKTVYTTRAYAQRFQKTVQLDIRGLPVIPVDHVVEVKYPSEYVYLVSDIARKNRDRYPVLKQRIRVGDEILELRFEKEPVENAGTTIVLMNEEGRVVASATNEWGTTLLQVTTEYRGKNLGVVLGRVWYEWNPKFESGGFTPQGERNAVRIWADRVRTYLDRGWYSALVRDGKLDVARVRSILAGLPDRPKFKPTDKPTDKPKAPGTVLVYTDGDSNFYVYDSNFIEDPDPKWILGYGFFRGNGKRMWLQAIDYERPYRVLTTQVALQIAKNHGERIYVHDPGDKLELAGIDHETDGDYVWIDHDVQSIPTLMRQEAKARKPHDRYGEVATQLMEMADSKW